LSKLDRADSPVIRFAIILAAFCVLLIFATSRADAAPWSGPGPVSALGADASASEVGVDADGDATAIWTNDAGAGSVVQAAYRPAGAGWEAPVDLSGPGGEVEGADLAVDPAGDAVAVWRVTTGGNFLVQAAFKPAGGSWQPSETVPISGAAGETPQVSIDEAGDAVVVYKDGAAGIFASYRPANGSWQGGVHISPGGAEAPDVVMNSAGAAIVVWATSSGPTSVIEANSMSPGGSWSTRQALSTAALVTEPPQVRSDAAGEFFALWSLGGSAGQTVELARKPVSGAWGAPEMVSTAGVEAEPQLAVDSDGDVVAAWYRSGGSAGSIEATSLSAGGSWAPPSRLSPAGVDSKSPRIAVSPAGVAQVVWTGTKEAEHHLELSTVHLQVNASWKASITITHEGQLVFAPRIGVDHSGRTVVTWSVETSVGVVVIKGSTHDERSSLNVTKSGGGAGTVTSFPARIDCGSICSGEFFEGITVTLTATPASGSRFAGWSGACSGVGACAVEIGESQSVNAEFVPTSSGDETGGDGEPGAGGTTTTTNAGASKAAAGPAHHAPAPMGPICTPITAAKVSGFVPKAKPGQVVPGVRAKVSVRRPSTVQVSAMLGFGKGSSIRLADLGSASFHTAGSRNLRFALPKGLRSALPLGSGAHLTLSIAAKPDAEQGCGQPSTVKRRLAVKVVRVLSGRQAGVS
jgi:Divergent InlB B-repeat domain